MQKMSEEYLANLPDALFYNILSYAEIPPNIASLICISIAPLCSSLNEYLQNDSIWELVLGAYSIGTGNSSSSNRRQRRQSKRLRRTTAKEDVMHAFTVRRANTDMALHDFGELAISKTPHQLSLARFRALVRNYGPDLNFDQRSVLGGTFLVDCCRARYVKESVILSCIKDLIQRHGASSNVSATEGHLYNHNPKYLPPLVVASARGMPSVVRYLIQDGGALVDTKGTSRFRLFKKPSRSIGGTFTALEFANAMKQGEIDNGATPQDLKSLEKCIQILIQQQK